MDKFQVVDEKDLQVIEGGIGTYFDYIWPKCYCIWRIWGWLHIWFRFGLVVGVR